MYLIHEVFHIFPVDIMRKFKALAFQEKNDVETWQQVKFHSFTPKPYEYVKKLELAKKTK